MMMMMIMNDDDDNLDDVDERNHDVADKDGDGYDNY